MGPLCIAKLCQPFALLPLVVSLSLSSSLNPTPNKSAGWPFLASARPLGISQLRGGQRGAGGARGGAGGRRGGGAEVVGHIPT